MSTSRVYKAAQWTVKRLSGQGCRVFECVVQITRDESGVIQLGPCDIAELGGESDATWP